jgi:hypothetical protein
LITDAFTSDSCTTSGTPKIGGTIAFFLSPLVSPEWLIPAPSPFALVTYQLSFFLIHPIVKNKQVIQVGFDLKIMVYPGFLFFPG